MIIRLARCAVYACTDSCTDSCRALQYARVDPTESFQSLKDEVKYFKGENSTFGNCSERARPLVEELLYIYRRYEGEQAAEGYDYCTKNNQISDNG